MAKEKTGDISVPLTGQTLKASLFVNENTFFRATVQSFQPLPDDHPCYALIGLIASECARIEHFLDATIFELLGLQSEAKMGACVTGQMLGMYPRYMALHQLAIERGIPKPLQAEIKRLIETSNDVANRRNRAVHDAWMEDMQSKEPHQFRTKAKKEPAYGPHPSPLEKLQEDLAFVRIHLKRVMKLRSEIWELYRPTP